MTLEETVAAFESQFASVETGPAASVCATGEPYVIMALPATLVRKRSVEADSVLAFARWLTAVRRYAEGRGTRLVWLQKPEAKIHRSRMRIECRMTVLP